MRMSAVLSGALEHELKGLNEAISAQEQVAQSAEKAHLANLDSWREKDVNPYVDDAAAASITETGNKKDAEAHRLEILRARQQGAMGKFVQTVPAREAAKSNAIVEAMLSMPGFDRIASAALGNGNIGTFDVGEISSREQVKAALQAGGEGLFAAGGDGAALIAIDQRLTPPLEILTRRVRLLDLITVDATDSDVVRYGKQTVRTSAAAAKAVGTAGVGVAYDQATYTWTNADVSVRSIGHYAKAPRENLADVPVLQGLIEGQLADDVLLQTESLVYSGDGTGQNFSGIKTEALAGSDFIVRDETNERRLSALHRAATAVRLAFMEPTAIWMHPTDYHNTLVEESTSGGFLLSASALASAQPTLWGLPVVQSSLATLGEPTVGDFKSGATLWVREGISVRISDSNEDDFIKRMIAILAEYRGAFAVKRPAAFSRIKNYT
jgi:HK97 family phage major capsid protein